MAFLGRGGGQVAQYEHQDEEINLLDFVRYIKKNFRFLLVMFLVCFIPFVIYVSSAQKVYRVQAYISPPLLQDFNELNAYSSSGLFPEFQVYEADDVFNLFTANLRSRDLQWDYFNESGMYEHYKAHKQWDDEYHAFVDGFGENLKIDVPKAPDGEEGSPVSITFDFTDETITEEILNELIVFVSRKTRIDLLENVKSEVDSGRRTLNQVISNKIEYAEIRRKDNLLVLQEALEIANRLGLDSSESSLLSRKEFVGGISVNTAEIPLYMRGKQAIAAEIDGLKSRESIEAFVIEIRDHQETLHMLERISIEEQKIKPVRLDQSPELQGKPVSPRTLILLVFGLFVSFVVSIAVMWFRYLWVSQKIQTPSS